MTYRRYQVLIDCERSGVVREAFKARGWDAWSCDLEDTQIPGNHIKGDAIEALHSRDWDLVIAHPPCTRLANSGVLRLYIGGKKSNGIDPVMWKQMENGAKFFKQFIGSCRHLLIENPIPHGYAIDIIGDKYSQIIQPHQFGEDASKATCLWLYGLPKLVPTLNFPPRFVNGRPRWGNQIDSGQNKLPPDNKGNTGLRAKLRSQTYQGIADAMADQYTRFIEQEYKTSLFQ